MKLKAGESFLVLCILVFLCLLFVLQFYFCSL